MRRFLFIHFTRLTKLAYCLWVGACLFLLYEIVIYWPSVQAVFKDIGVDIDNPGVVNLVTGIILILAPILTKPVWSPALRQWLSHQLLPVNIGVRESVLEKFEAYHLEISNKVKTLLPDELSDAWSSGQQENRYMIPLRAEEGESLGTGWSTPGNIEDLLYYLDINYFWKVSGRLQPITLQGEPGAGKSTLIFELYRQSANRLLQQKQGWIPLLIFAHNLSWETLNKHASLKEFLIDYFTQTARYSNGVGYTKMAELLSYFYDELQFLIIIDGLDEIPNRHRYEEMTKKLNQLLEAEWKTPTPKRTVNRYLVTCRSDDNQRLIASRLITLLNLDYENVLKHLKRLRSMYRRRGDSKEKEISNIIEGLETSKSRRLLQNYIHNPYLLSLIRTYYREFAAEPAETLDEVFRGVLNKIFRDVLDRELLKSLGAFEAEELKRKRRGDLSSYLISLLAPYCFHRIIHTLDSTAPEGTSFKLYLTQDEELANTLFGSNANVGYLKAFFENYSTETGIRARENGIRRLTELWGRVKTDDFREAITPLRDSSPDYKEFAYKVFRHLHRDVLDLLDVCRLAEVDQTTQTILRFRHRRMQDYFAAHFIDKVGIIKNGGTLIPLDNAWMREPIRILAAVSAKPDDLIGAFLRAYDERKVALADANTDILNELANLLLNASEAIAYLPKPERLQPIAPLYADVLKIGTEAEELYFVAARATGGGEQSGKQKGWLNLQDKCLGILRNIYASEFLRGDRAIFNTTFVVNKRNINRWKWIHYNLEQESSAYQHIAYTHLYPIKLAQRRLPITRLSLLFYIIDACFCFQSAYDRLIKNTHPQPHRRFVLKAGEVVEDIVSWSMIALPFYLLWGPVTGWKDLFEYASRAFALAGAGMVAGFIIQKAGWMHLVDAHHVFTWLMLRMVKSIWLDLKLIIRKLMDGILEAIAIILSLIIRFFRRLIENPIWLALLASVLLVGTLAKAFILPPLFIWLDKRTYASQAYEFTSQAKIIREEYKNFSNASEGLSGIDPEEALNRIGNTENKIDRWESEATELLGKASYLNEMHKKYAEVPTDEINRLKEEIEKQRESIKDIEAKLTLQKNELTYTAQTKYALDDAVEVMRETEGMSVLPPSVNSPGDLQQYLSNAKAESEKIESVTYRLKTIKENGRFASSKYRDSINNIEKRLDKRKNDISQIVLQASAGAQHPPTPETAPDERDVLKHGLIERSNSILDDPNLKEWQDELETMSDFTAGGLNRLKDIEELAQVQSKPKWWSARRQLGRVQDALRLLSKLERADSKSESIRQYLVQHQSDTLSLLRQIENRSEHDMDTKPLKDHLALIESYLAQNDSYVALRKPYDVEGMKERLVQSSGQLKLEADQQDRLLITASLILLSWLGFVILWGYYGDRHGMKQVMAKKNNFEKLVKFIESNPYSFRVNEKAIIYLKQHALNKADVSKLRRVSDAAEARLKRAGEINERIGYLLKKDVAEGIENILNRHPSF